jgi:hypothetical protein
MAKLVVVTHEFDSFLYKPQEDPTRLASNYLLFDVLRHLNGMGHSSVVTRGLRIAEGDVALLHVDATYVDEDYVALGKEYGRAINFETADISKRRISSLLLSKNDEWRGPVVVKSNRNCQAFPEALHNDIAVRRGRPLPHPGVERSGPYRVLDRMSEVEEAVWSDENLVVERFIPEMDEAGGYAIRTWVFMGKRERCTRTVNRGWIVKAAGAIKYEPVPVPEELRIIRDRLKFQFGKFDFVIHNGAPVLLDANRTPGTAPAIEQLMKSGARNLAEGLDEMLRQG